MAVRTSLRPETQTAKQRQERNSGWGGRTPTSSLHAAQGTDRPRSSRVATSTKTSGPQKQLPEVRRKRNGEPRCHSADAGSRQGQGTTKRTAAQEPGAPPTLLLGEPRARAAPTYFQKRKEDGEQVVQGDQAPSPICQTRARTCLLASPGPTLLQALAQAAARQEPGCRPRGQPQGSAKSLEEPRQSCRTSQAPTISGEAQAAGREGGGGLVFKPSAVRGPKDGVQRPHSHRTGARSPLLSHSGVRACPEPLLSGSRDPTQGRKPPISGCGTATAAREAPCRSQTGSLRGDLTHAGDRHVLRRLPLALSGQRHRTQVPHDPSPQRTAHVCLLSSPAHCIPQNRTNLPRPVRQPSPGTSRLCSRTEQGHASWTAAQPVTAAPQREPRGPPTSPEA